MYASLSVKLFIFKITLHSQKPKFQQLILRKIINIVATGCQILKRKCTTIDFADPDGSLYRCPRPL